MSPNAEPPRDREPTHLADRLVEHALSGAEGNRAAATSLLVEGVYAGLLRWFGPYGTLALVTRALSRAQSDHPVLKGVVASASTTPHVTGWPSGTTAAEVAALREAVVAVLACLYESLARLIGDDLAETLLTQRDPAPVPSPTEMPVSPNASDE